MTTQANEHTIPDRGSIAPSDCWDLSSLYENEAEWESDMDRAEAVILSIATFKGRLGEGPLALARYLMAAVDARLLRDRVVEYAARGSDVDTSNTHKLGLKQRALTMANRLAAAMSFARAELLALPEDELAAALDHEAVSPHRVTLERILREKAHTLTSAEEALLARAGELARAPHNIFNQLTNADMRFGTITGTDGNPIEVGHGNYSTLMMHPERGVRKAAYEAYYGGFDANRHAISAALDAAVRTDVFYSNARGYKTARQAALFPDAIPEAVYDNLISTVRAKTDLVARYYRVLRQALGVDTLRPYDLLAPMVPNGKLGYAYEDGVSLVARALAPLGEEYTRTLSAGLLGGWVDRYPSRGKVPGAYSAGVYGSHPYILLNYRGDDIEHVYTLAHEAGHSMHTLFADRMQPPQYAPYSIFVAEVASTFNEVLLTNHLLETTDDPRMRARLINRELVSLRSLLYRQTMFAEFEARLHKRVEDNQALSLDDIRSSYRELLVTYHTDELAIDPLLELESLRIPHFYYGFYVYQYATGVSAALALAEKVLQGGDREREEYLGFLGLGGSVFPMEALARAGVDMTQPEPIEAALRYFERRVGELEAMMRWLD